MALEFQFRGQSIRVEGLKENSPKKTPFASYLVKNISRRLYVPFSVIYGKFITPELLGILRYLRATINQLSEKTRLNLY